MTEDIATKVSKELEEPERRDQPRRDHCHRQRQTELIFRPTSRVGKRSRDSSGSASLRHIKTSARIILHLHANPALGRVRELTGGTDCGM